MLQGKHSAILLICIKQPHGFQTFVCLFLSGRLRQVFLYMKIEAGSKGVGEGEDKSFKWNFSESVTFSIFQRVR